MFSFDSEYMGVCYIILHTLFYDKNKFNCIHNFKTQAFNFPELGKQ